MEMRKIGAINVSVVGLGCNNFGWRIGPEESAAVVNAAIDAGVNFFDTADVYGEGRSEEFLGGALTRRREVVIATKFGMKFGANEGGAKPDYIRKAAEASLRRLGTDYIDLYQLHKSDSETPIADTLGALDDLVRAGKVREIGCSNFNAAQLREASDAAKPGAAPFVSVQNDYSLLNRSAEGEVLPECVREGLAFLPYFPLANGLLTGKYAKGQQFPEDSRGKVGFGPKVFTDENLDLADQLMQFAATRGRTLLELAISWLACQPTIASVIAGAKTTEQIRANAASAGWRLTRSEMNTVDEIQGLKIPQGDAQVLGS